MISQATIEALEQRRVEYVLGARERSDKRVRSVIDDAAPFVPLLVERSAGDTQLFVKEVVVDGVRNIACRNEAEARNYAADRKAVVTALDAQLKPGDQALGCISAYRRYLRKTGADAAFEIDVGKLADEARYDQLFVLRTNTRISPLQAVLRYRELLVVEALFRAAKATFSTRLIFHSSDAAIRGHVFCSFLALILRKEIFERCSGHQSVTTTPLQSNRRRTNALTCRAYTRCQNGNAGRPEARPAPNTCSSAREWGDLRSWRP
nr:hypothetical protein [Salinarimonas ramus]